MGKPSRIFTCEDGSVGIMLAHDRGVAYIDAADLPVVLAVSSRWSLQIGKSAQKERRYAVAYGGGGRRRKSTAYLHRVVLGLKKGDGVDVDHRDDNGLNNRRQNLRIATRSQNIANGRARRNRHSGLKGVYAQPTSARNPWTTRLTVRGSRIYVGCFPHREEAAMAYNVAARKHFGAFARLNQVDMG